MLASPSTRRVAPAVPLFAGKPAPATLDCIGIGASNTGKIGTRPHRADTMPLPLIYHDDYSPEFPPTIASRWTSSACCAITWWTVA